MYIDFSQLSPSERYFSMTQTIVPRPIAWVLSENADGGLNLAPFSYFSAVCSDPPLISLSVGTKADGTLKDTRRNIVQRKHFVVHIAHTELLESLNASAETFAENVSEVSTLGLETVAFQDFALPRLAACRIAFACELHAEVPLGTGKFSLLLAEVKTLFVDDSCAVMTANGRLKVDAEGLQALGRLGAGEYMQFGKLITLKSPA